MDKMDTLSLTTKGVGRLADEFAKEAPYLHYLKLKADGNVKLEVESLEQLGILTDFKILNIGKQLSIPTLFIVVLIKLEALSRSTRRCCCFQNEILANRTLINEGTTPSCWSS